MIRNNGLHPKLSISVIVTVKNGNKNLLNCLNGISKSLPAAQEIIIVAIGGLYSSLYPQDSQKARVYEVAADCKLPDAQNIGANRANGHILFFIDPDIVIPKDAFYKLINEFRIEPGLAAVVGCYDDSPAKFNFLSQYHYLREHYLYQIAKNDTPEIFSFCGAVRREAFQEIGGFSTHYPQRRLMDFDFVYRLKKRGRKIKLAENLQVKSLKCLKIFSTFIPDSLQSKLLLTELRFKRRSLDYPYKHKLTELVSSLTIFMVLIFLFISAFYKFSGIPVEMAYLWVLGLLLFNGPFYFFLSKKRKLFFAVRAICWHWLSMFLSGLAFLGGIGRSIFVSKRSPDLQIVAD